MAKIVFLGTGGTIAGTSSDPQDKIGYRAAQIGIAQLVQAVPGLAATLGGRTAEYEQVAQVDSKDMDFSHWVALAQRVRHHVAQADVVGLVVTHGTDTIEETAYFLSRVLASDVGWNKPVVLTCAMRPASALAPDGPQNLRDATTVAAWPGAKGVVVVCAGKIHSALHVQKVHPYRLDAFDSGDAGVLGTVQASAVQLTQGWGDASGPPTSSDFDRLLPENFPRVEIVMNYVGATGATVRAMCQGRPGEAPVRGVVVAGTGNGTVQADLEAALRQLQSQGIRVVRASRCPYGQVVPPSTPGDALPHSNGLSAVKARIALMLDLMG